MDKKNINKTVITAKYPLAFLLIIFALISLSLFMKIFTDLNLENFNWVPSTEYEVLTRNILIFIGWSIVTLVLYYFKKKYREEPTLTFDGRFLYLEVANNVVKKIAMTDISEFHKPLLQYGKNASRWEISYLSNSTISKIEVLVIQQGNFTQFRKITKRRNPSVKFTGLY
jgi:hypothetical protein